MLILVAVFMTARSDKETVPHFVRKILLFQNKVLFLQYQVVTINLYTMKTYSYTLRPVTDINDIVLYYEFVRMEDDAILRSSKDFDFLFAYADGFTAAANSSFVVE